MQDVHLAYPIWMKAANDGRDCRADTSADTCVTSALLGKEYVTNFLV